MSLYDGLEVETAPMPDIIPSDGDSAPTAKESSKKTNEQHALEIANPLFQVDLGGRPA